MKIKEKKKISPSSILFIIIFLCVFFYLQPKSDISNQVKTPASQEQEKIDNNVLYGDTSLPKDVIENMSDVDYGSDPSIEKIKKRFSKKVSKSVLAQMKMITFKHSGTCDVKLVLSKTGVVLRHYVSACKGDEKFQREVVGKIRSAITQLPEPPEKIFDIARNVEFKVAG